MAIALKIAAGLVVAYLLVMLAGHSLQRRFLYFPSPDRVLPAQVGLTGVEERVLKTPDGARVVAWYAKAKPGQATVLYFHGNGGSLAARAPRIRAFQSEGFGIFMMSYRGYGGSSGTPSEVANVADARLAYGALRLEGVPAERLILYGESLGSGVAARVATERAAAGLVLEAPYTSILEIGQREFPYLPLSLLLTDRYETDKVIQQVHMPVLVLHGKLDGVIDFDMGQRLFALANEPKTFEAFPDGSHSDLYATGNDAMGRIVRWVQSLKLPAATP